MRVRFKGPEDECVVFGQTFPRGEWVAVAGEAKRLVGNPTFDVDADRDGEPEPTIEQMRERLELLGVKPHPKAGLKRLAELLAEHDHGDLS